MRVAVANFERIAKGAGGVKMRSRAGSPVPAFAPSGCPPGPLVAIGASAGGPSALAHVLARLPADFPAPIVIVQHIHAQFAPGLASWLDQQTPLPVRLAREGDVLVPGTVLLADGDRHLVLNSPARLGYSAEPAACSYRPSVDALFLSLERCWHGEIIAVLLSGMGRDGAAGLRRLRDRGHYTLAQDQATSAVYGMPKAAVQLGAAREVISVEHIGARLVRLTAANQRRTYQKLHATA